MLVLQEFKDSEEGSCWDLDQNSETKLLEAGADSGSRILDLIATATAMLMETRKQENHIARLRTFASPSSLLP